MRVEGDEVLFKRPMYAGKVHAEVRVSSSPILATIRPKSYKPQINEVAISTEKIAVDVPSPKVTVNAYEGSSNGKLDVTEADIIVSGGRGMQGPEHWSIIENLAGLLGAATGCSRPVSDDGWRPHEERRLSTGWV